MKARKVAIVTGASRGIGRAIAVELGRSGWSVVINYLANEEKARETAIAAGHDSESITIQADVAEESQVEQMVSATLIKFGRLDLLVNNAGAVVAPFDWRNATMESWQRTIDVNLASILYCTRCCAQHLVHSDSGRIVNIGSTYGTIGDAAVAAYSAAKAGVVSLTRSFAKELAPQVTVNAVLPGNIDTDMTRAAGDAFLKSVIARTPLKRLGTPAEVAYAVEFLASERAAFITGATFVVDGGHSLR